MSDKFIPNKDREFADMATSFASSIARGRETYEVTENECAWLVQQVKEFLAALELAKGRGTGTQSTRSLKDEARGRLEEIVRRIANQVRVNPRISTADKLLLRIKERPKRLGKRTVPFAAPALEYMGYPPKAGPNCGHHQLRFTEGVQFVQRSKPNGAVRIELFMDLVAPGDPVPQFPGQYLGGRPWYLRSFSRSPFKVKHPMPPMPMQVVYWARWADAHGNVGPFSQTCVARVEGWATGNGVDRLLGPMPEVKVLEKDPKYITTITQLRQIEQVRVERLLPDSAPAAGEAGQGEVRCAPRELEGPAQLPPPAEAA